jgi:AcrR family transcriptional regulator
MGERAPTAPRRRLSPKARRQQLTDTALAVIAERGPLDLDLDLVAERSGVTRNLIYHYFPRGRIDLVLAAVEEAGRQLTAGWVTEPELPLEERMAANFARLQEHALAPSEAWLAFRQMMGSGEGEIAEVLERYRGVIVAAISRNHFGTADPPPPARLAIRSYLAFAERALDQCREQEIDPGLVFELLRETLLAVAASARRLCPEAELGIPEGG